jgi:hypothetical protein
MSYKVVSISSGRPDAWYYLYDEYFKSLNDTPPTVFQPVNWGGLSTKPKILYQAIVQKQINTKYIIFCDCWDLVFAATPNEIMERYFTFGSPIVISSEKNCFPDDLKKEFDELNPPTIYKYLNSGFIVGETDAILACLEAMDLPNMQDDHYDPVKNCNVHPNDQYEWMKIFVKQPVKIRLDYGQELSQTMHDTDIEDFDLSKTRIRNRITNSHPCVFHFNGGSKDNMTLREPILKHLNLS